MISNKAPNSPKRDTPTKTGMFAIDTPPKEPKPHTIYDFTPQNLALQGVRRTALNVNFYARALFLVRALKKRLQK